MSQSLAKQFIHIIYHIKNNSPHIKEQEEQELYAYIGSIIKDNESIPIIINGVSDHIHILLILSKNISLAKIVEEIKKHSSRWIKTKSAYYSKFSWQGGYGGFFICPSLHDKTKKYIENQKQHHKTMSFKEEYLLFLKEYGIEYNEKYLWND